MEQSRPPIIGAATDPGLERTENQDHMDRVSLSYGELLLVADGMGGHAGGATASRLALQEIRRHAESCAVEPNNADSLREMLYYATMRANEAVYQYWQTRPELKGMGTTLVAALVVDGLAWVAHVGDSRIYLVEGSAGRVTRDHTAVQDRMDHGILTVEEAKNHPDRHILSRAIGHKPEVEPEVRMGPIDLKPGASLLLCSDGLCDVVTDEEIGDVVLTSSPQKACEALIRLANQRGGPDNTTVMIYRQPGGRLRSRSTQAVRRTFRKKVLGLSLLVWLAVAAALAAVALGAFLLWPRADGEGKGETERGPATAKEAPTGKAGKEKHQDPGATQPQGQEPESEHVETAVDQGEDPRQRDVEEGAGTAPVATSRTDGIKIVLGSEGKAPEKEKKSTTTTPGTSTKQLKPRAGTHCDTGGVKPEDLPKAVEFCEKVEQAWRHKTFYVSEDLFREAEKIRQATPAIQATYYAASRDLAEHCRKSRLEGIRSQAQTGNCDYACRDVARGLKYYANDNVGHDWLVLDAGGAAEALGQKCMDADKIPCALVRKKLNRPEPNQPSAQQSPEPTAGSLGDSKPVAQAKPEVAPKEQPVPSGGAGTEDTKGALGTGRTEITNPDAPPKKLEDGTGEKQAEKKGKSEEKPEPLDFGK